MQTNIGQHIRNARLRKGYTQEQLAELLGVSFQAISAWECGNYLPDTDKLIALSQTLEVSIDLLLSNKSFVGKGWVLEDRIFNEHHMHRQVYHSARNLHFVNTLKALDFATRKHEHVYRKGKDRVPYIYHPLLMACHALAMGLKEDRIIATCLLHDVCEDCSISPGNLPVETSVQQSVALLTRDPSDDFASYVTKLSEDKTASLVKILDRCCNISTMATGFSEAEMAEYIAETENYILPLIERTRKTYPEFYDACFICKYQILAVISTIKHIIK